MKIKKVITPHGEGKIISEMKFNGVKYYDVFIDDLNVTLTIKAKDVKRR